MTSDQIIILAILLATMATFLWGRLRHDLIAMGALLVCVFAGLVPGGEAFAGFGHPAVITVGCVLVLSYGLQLTGAVDVLAQRILPASAGPTVSILSLCALAAVLSGFMNNVGAMALLMPVAIQMADKQGMPPGRFLMPLAFGSILGGTTTLIGTPPNLIVAGFRAEAGFGRFAMFDYTPVGLVVAAAGTLFVGLVGWRLVPVREQPDKGSFDTGTYLSEARIVEGSKAIDKRLSEVEEMLEDADAQIVGLVRDDLQVAAPTPWHRLREGDILVIEAEPESIAAALSNSGLKLEEDVPAEAEEDEDETAGHEGEAEDEAASSLKTRSAEADSDSDKDEKGEEEEKKPEAGDVVIQELVVIPSASLIGHTASNIRLRTRYSINLLAISRKGRRTIKRLRSTVIRPGDVLLMRGEPQALAGFASHFGCLPLAGRDIRIPDKGQALMATLIMVAAVAAAALGLVPVEISFAAAVVAFILLGIVPLRSVYTTIDWSVIVLLAAMLPVAGAMSTTGAADLIAGFFIEQLAQGHAVLVLTVILVVTMVLTDFMNNAATAAVMCPISLSSAAQLSVNSDCFLMAVAVGASCSFLTPIGHQNNTLILGPGGFRFGDYWRLGLPTEILLVAVSVPMLLWVWPL